MIDATPIAWNYTKIIFIHIHTYLITMINYKSAKRFCSDNISSIKNYNEAVLDSEEMWDCHHILGESTSRKELIRKNLYFKRPSSELMFMKSSLHQRLHNANQTNPMLGKHHSEESRMKISDTRKERIANGDIVVDTSNCHTEEANRKISEKAKERLSNPENHPMFGRHQSEETKKKISEAKKGRVPWNKGRKMKKIGN